MRNAADIIRILHVDDEPDFADMAATFLEREDDRFHVETETSASAGLDRLSEVQFDCVITDYDMPGQSGIEFLESVRGSDPDLPVILFTGKGSEEIASNAISAGVTDYLQKGSGTDQYTVLANRIQNAVERRKVTQERNRHLEAIETAQEGIAVLDEEGHYIYVNQRFSELHGYDPEELIGEHWELVYRDEDIPEVREDILPEVQREGYWHGETVSLREDGSTVTVDHALALTDQGELVCTVRDISDRKDRQQELQKKTAQLEALFENSPDMINVHDTDGSIVNPNPRLCDETGYDPEELTGMKVWDLDRSVDPDEARALWAEMEVGDSQRLEGRYRRRDGSTFPVEVHVRHLPLGEKDRFVATARDITDRKERKAELERYERIVENLPVGVFRTTPGGEFIDVNEQYVSLLDADSEADLANVEAGEFWADPDDRETLLRELEQEGAIQNREVEVETLDSESKWVETTLRIVDEDGNQYLDGIAQDVTERREMRRRLEQAETMFENVQDALFIIDVSDEFTIERVNPAYERATGLSNEALSDRTPRDVVGDEQGAEIEEKYRNCVEERTTLEYEETLSIDGEQTYWETRIAPVLIDGEVAKIVGATRNITDRKDRERKFELVETLFEHAQECQFIVDVAGGEFELRHANDYYKRTVGLSPGESVTGQTPTELFGDAGGREIIDRYMECVETRESVTYTVELPVPEEGTTYRTILTPVVSEDRVTHIVGTARDITDHKLRKEELERQNARLEEFASVVSHDLRNPLRVAEGRLELLQEECESDHIDYVAQALDRMDALIEDLLRLAREGDRVGEVEPVVLAALVENCWQHIESPEAEIVTDCDRIVLADRSRLQQLLGNLLRNAVEHGGEDVTITVGELDAGFYVEDDGLGIPRETWDDVFEAGYSTSEGGTGFGLAIVKQVAEDHGWNVGVREGSSGGARFEITGVEFNVE